MTYQQRAILWLSGLAALVLTLGLLRGVLLPFVVAMAMAYFLNPLADRLERVGLARPFAASLIVLVMTVVIGLILVLAVPLLVSELKDLASNLPKLVQDGRARLEAFVEARLGAEYPGLRQRIDAGVNQLTEGWVSSLTQILVSLVSGGAALVNVLSLVLITPVVAFYLLCDWPRMLDRIDSWLPRAQASTIRRLAREINAVLAGFVRGQGTVCLVLAAIYGIGLTWVGIRSGWLIGVVTGLLSFIPFVGFALGLATACALALAQSWPDWIPLAKVVGVFGVGQALEAAVLSPRIVAGHIRLHPVWLIFALFVFGYLFGFVGLLVAVPTAAALGVLARFAIEEYLKSPLYDAAVAASVPPQDGNEGRQK
jgi:predicted PurR-regulated permease PerM